jgi:hypothetical protein
MTFRVISHNCCDLVRWQVRDQTRFEVFKDLSRPFSFFEVQDVIEPDIALTVGPFKSNDSVGQFWVDHKYLVGPNYIYCRERLARGWYEVEIQGLDDAQIAIKFHGKLSLLARAIAPLALVHHSILRPVLLYHLSRRGACLLHGAGIHRDERAIVLTGRGGTFKTSLAMDLVRLEGYRFLGDDAIVVSDTRAYPFPTHPQLFIYRALHLKNEELAGLLGRIRALRFLMQSDLSTLLGKVDLFGTTAVPLSAVVVVGRKRSTTTVQINEIDRQAAIDRLVANSYLETAVDTVYLLGRSPTVFASFLDAYALVYPDSRAATFWGDFTAELRQSLDGVACYELVLPATYTEQVSDQARSVINDIVV